MKVVHRFIRDFENLPHRCAILAYEDGGSLTLIKFSWNQAPVSAVLTEWRQWFTECYATLDAQYGPGACKRAKIEHDALGENHFSSAP